MARPEARALRGSRGSAGVAWGGEVLSRVDQTGDLVCFVRGGIEGVSGGAGQPASFPPQPGLQRGESRGCAPGFAAVSAR